MMVICCPLSGNMQKTIWKHFQSNGYPVFWSTLENPWSEDCMNNDEIESVDVLWNGLSMLLFGEIRLGD